MRLADGLIACWTAGGAGMGNASGVRFGYLHCRNIVPMPNWIYLLTQRIQDRGLECGLASDCSKFVNI